MSKVYFALPETLSGPSMREMRLPIWTRFCASGHLYSAIALFSFPRRLLGRRLSHCSSHSDISPATAQVATQATLHLLRRWTGILIKERLAGHHETGSAESALLRIVVDECLLNGMKLAALCKTFNRCNFPALNIDREE